MAVEIFGYISNLVASNPVTDDPVSQGDDHLRGIKQTLLNSFPNVNAAVTATAEQLNSTALPQGYVPVGGVVDFAGTAAPTGFLALPLVPTNISRTTYAALFAAIGITWGAGDGSTTFGMPYMPADYSAVAANANVGTATVGQAIDHTHDVELYTSRTGVNLGGNGTFWTGSKVAKTTVNDTTGDANLAAGVRFLKCVRYV